MIKRLIKGMLNNLGYEVHRAGTSRLNLYNSTYLPRKDPLFKLKNTDSFPEIKMNPFDFFDKIYCINLDENPERWQQAQLEFETLGIADRVERFPGIKHERGAVGCFMSHITCVKTAAQLGIERVFIFEDDIKFISNDLDILRSGLNSLQEIPDWDLFYLGGRLMKKADFIGPNLFESKLLACHAYGVNLTSVDKFEESYNPIDVFYSYNMNSYAIYPLMAVQHAGYSHVEQRHVDYKESAYRRTYEKMTKGLPSNS